MAMGMEITTCARIGFEPSMRLYQLGPACVCAATSGPTWERMSHGIEVVAVVSIQDVLI